MNVVDLDSIREAAEAKYGDVTITVAGDEVVLRNPLKLRKDKRAALIAKQDELDAEDADQEALLGECIHLIAERSDMAQRLLDAIGENLPVLVGVFDEYAKATALGEASASAS